MTYTPSLGVVVGRFQVPELHDGHRHIITYAKERADALLIIIGSGRGLPTARNPLSFAVRKAMVADSFKEATILEHFDHPSDITWSTGLDALIQKTFPGHRVTLYGSRDSFIPHYHGTNRTEVVPEIPSTDGTTIRRTITQATCATPDFRRGIIHVHATRPPIPYPVVDVAIMHPTHPMVLLGEKAHDAGKRRFIGGFFDPDTDTSFEMTVRREVYEETSGVEIGDLAYVGSSCINDWRYRNDKDRIVSTFFKATYIFGAPRPGDDLDALHWTPYTEMLDALVPQHRHFGELLLRSLRKE